MILCEEGSGCNGDVAQMVERSLSMREVLGSIPSFSIVLNVQLAVI